MIWFIVGLVALLALIWGIDVYCHRHPLTPEEALRLAEKRRRNKALFEYRYSTHPSLANPTEKKAMKSQGEFVSCAIDYSDAPARIAGLLKYKRHEWIVIAFITSKCAVRLWWNKGPDGTQVWSCLRNHALRATIRALQPDTIAILHNHPNPDPSRYRANLPSEADLRSAGFYDELLGKLGITLLEFICERGTPHLYYARFSDRVVPIDEIVREIQGVNGAGLFKNYSLRKELKQTTNAEKVPGGVR